MKFHFFLFFLLVAVLSTAVRHAIAAGSTALVFSASQDRAGGRSLLSLSDSETELAAKLDGTVSLRTRNSRRIIWSFQSGSPIYSSYQAPADWDNGPTTDYFFDCGDDWELYAHAAGYGKMKLHVTVEEFVKHMPHVSEDGAVTLGSKSTTVYVLDAMTGRLLQTYSSPDYPSISQNPKDESSSYSKNNTSTELIGIGSLNTDQKRFHVTRTDYVLKSFHPNSDKLSWNLTVAEIGAVLICQDDDVPSIIATSNASSAFGSKISCDFDMPFPCQSKGAVIREHGKLEPLHARSHGDPLLSLPSSNMLPSQTKVGGLSIDNQENRMLPASSPEPILASKRKLDKSSNDSHEESKEVQTPPPTKTRASIVLGDVRHLRMPYIGKLSSFSERSAAFLFILFIVILLGFFIVRYALAAKELAALKVQLGVPNLSLLASKKKKTRKSGKNNAVVEKKNEFISSEDGKDFPDMKRLLNSGVDGRAIGKLIVSKKEIAKGSNGTVVLEGFYEGRPVAVKRLVQAHHDLAFKEIQNLIASDRHPNIVRWYGVEYDQDFVYLSLERCSCSLNDVIRIYSDSSQNQCFVENHAAKGKTECKIRLASVEPSQQDLNLWKASGHPSPVLIKLMRDVVSGLAHLHDLGIIHRELKPQNVLITKENYLCAKLSDMGISKRLLGDRSSLGHHPTGCGSSGWQAPEQLLHLRQTRAVDLFSLGCVLFYCVTGGRHPFGDHLERDVNIVKNKLDLFVVDFIPEAYSLISCLLNPNPELRPTALEVLHHPLFWSSETRLSFLRDASDRVELEDREAHSDVLKALENIAPIALGGKWDVNLEPIFINNIGSYRRYRFESVRDLLRVIRNKYNHFRELPRAIQELVGPVPEGFDGYFASRFPRLLIEVYKVISNHCGQEEWFRKYIKSNYV